jgi:hypothetical protein
MTRRRCCWIWRLPSGWAGDCLVLLRPGNAGPDTAADHLVVIREALQQLPFQTSGRVGRKVLVRIDGVGATPTTL